MSQKEIFNANSKYFYTFTRYTQEVEHSYLNHLEGVHRDTLFYVGTCERVVQKF